MSPLHSFRSSSTGRYLRGRFLFVLAIVWLAAMAVLYYLRHNPLEPLLGFSLAGLGAKLAAAAATPAAAQVVAGALGLNLLDALAVALLVALGGGLGGLILPGGAAIPDAERPILQALLGLGLCAIMALAAGMLGLFPSRLLAWLIAVALAAGLNRQILQWGRGLVSSCRELLRPADGGLDRWLGWAILILLSLPLLIALLPPFQWDTLTYHLEGPRLYLDAGRIVSFPENHFLGFPQTVEMLYLWLIIVARPNAAGLLHWVFGVMAVLLSLSLGRRAGRPGAGLIAAVGLLACDSLWNELTFPYNDLALVAFVSAAVCAVLAWADDPGENRRRLLVAAGLFVGLSMGTKYTAFGAAIGIAALVAWIARREGLLEVVRACGLVTIAAVIIFSPWLVKNAILDGNPVSPFIWGTRAFDRFDQSYYLRAGTGLDPLSVLLAPIQGTVFGRDQTAPYGGSTGVMVFTLLPLALLGWKRRDQHERDLIVRLAIFVTPPYLIWLAGVATSWYLIQTRLLYPVFPAFLVIGGLGVEGLRAQRPNPDPSMIARLIAAAAAAIAIWVGLFPTLLSANWLVELGLGKTDDYLAAHMGDTLTAFEQINALPGPATVQMLWEPRTYYCEKKCIPDSGIDLWWHDRQVEPDPHKIVQGWRAGGITHVLVFEAGLSFMMTDPIESKYEPLTANDVAALDEVRRTEFVPVWRIPGSYSLYRIGEGAP